MMIVFVRNYNIVCVRYCGFIKDEDSESSSNEDGADVDDGSQAQKTNKPAIVIFASNKGLALLRAADEVHLDGTFSTAPKPFNQIFMVQAKNKDTRSVTVVFCLLSKKVTTLDVSKIIYTLTLHCFLIR